MVTDVLERKKLQSPLSVFSLAGREINALAGTAASLHKIPGQFTDASVGEVFARVHTRGISISAEDDIGWYYTGLYEDGLPVSAVQYNYYSPDFFFRPDLSVRQLEAIRGGKSVVLGSNTPASIVNFLTLGVKTSYFSHDRITAGLYDNGNFYGRVEGVSGGPIGQKGWFHGFSYLYRYDQGPKNLDYTLNEGGQFKAAIHKVWAKGLHISFPAVL